jgi:hypothetical protein
VQIGVGGLQWRGRDRKSKSACEADACSAGTAGIVAAKARNWHRRDSGDLVRSYQRLLALIHQQLGRAASAVGATAAAIIFLPLFILGLPGLLMLCGAALALGGVAQQDCGTFLIGGVITAVGYIWNKNQSWV